MIGLKSIMSGLWGYYKGRSRTTSQMTSLQLQCTLIFGTWVFYMPIAQVSIGFWGVQVAVSSALLLTTATIDLGPDGANHHELDYSS